MSYDIELLPRGRVDEILRQYESQDADSVVLNPGPSVAEREEWKRRLRGVLIREEPKFEQFEFDFHEIARIDSISEGEARTRYRHVELNLLESDRSGIQVTLYDQTVSITIPYWHNEAAASQVFVRVGRYIELLENSGDLVTYDPQVGRIVRFATDLGEILQRYLSVMARIPDIVDHSRMQPKRWWHLW
jgi:hypothetical protein